MRFEWDPRKNALNRAKHGLSFETAVLVFEDPLSVTVFDRKVDGEDRWHTIGMAGGITLLLVVHTVTDDSGEEVIRLISARKATANERKRHEQADL
ncbi:MAG: BrnT family toxin [Pseudomonadota bacterium]|jgi:uncharacterized protein|nr:BrnT family toxin [Pseudomonadota bacterium]